MTADEQTNTNFGSSKNIDLSNSLVVLVVAWSGFTAWLGNKNGKGKKRTQALRVRSVLTLLQQLCDSIMWHGNTDNSHQEVYCKDIHKCWCGRIFQPLPQYSRSLFRLWDLGNSQKRFSSAFILPKGLYWANMRPLNRKVPGQQLLLRKVLNKPVQDLFW